MPRVHHVKKARKDNPAVKAGESYFWWKFRNGGKQYSKTRPRASQLTQSGYLTTVYSLNEAIGDGNYFSDLDNVESDLNDIHDQLEELRSECQDSLDAMPYELQETSSSGELLQERIDALEAGMDEVQSIDTGDVDELIAECDKINEADLVIPDELQDRIHEALSEISSSVQEAIDQCAV